MVAVLNVRHAPRVVADELEGAASLTLLLPLETDVVVLDRLAPPVREVFARGGVDARLAALLLYEHVVEVVALEVVDVSVDGGVAPVEEQSRCGNLGERLVGIAVVHTVVRLFGAVPHGVVNHVSALVAVIPYVVRVPEYLRCPYAVDGAPVLVGRLRRVPVAENLHALTVVEGDALPVDEVLATEEVHAVVVPFLALLDAHVRCHHDVALSVVRTRDISVACTSFDSRVHSVVKHRLSFFQVLIMIAVSRYGVGCPFTTITHVAV